MTYLVGPGLGRGKFSSVQESRNSRSLVRDLRMVVSSRAVSKKGDLVEDLLKVSYPEVMKCERTNRKDKHALQVPSSARFS